MSDTLGALLRLLELETLEADLFRGQSQDLGFGALFGGQVLGQALSAATRTVASDRCAHSLHGYFLRAGDASHPIVYQVERIRDGKSFATRRVVAVQHGRPIFNLSASFQVHEPGFDHQDEAPEGIAGPEGLLSDHERLLKHAEHIPEPLREKLLVDRPVEVREVDPVDPFAPRKRPPFKAMWMRAGGELPDDPAVHRYLLAYASDFGLVGAALYPHAHTWWEREMQVASIDHAMWFHRPVRMDGWLLYVMDSPSAAGGRGLARGRIFQDGVLVASTAQEGLIRWRGDWPPPARD
ncbi:MAG: acyl-CoA thioesterase II [Deltaproteobacteria bacterium]|nr:acyl-CoA thioesterase II [Deltaproteobacteria bacterium]